MTTTTTTQPLPTVSELKRLYGWHLFLTRCDDGWSYEWQDIHGAVVCCGWSQGTKTDARAMALSHVASEGY